MSVLIVGVGTEDFSAMVELDGDDGECQHVTTSLTAFFTLTALCDPFRASNVPCQWKHRCTGHRELHLI